MTEPALIAEGVFFDDRVTRGVPATLRAALMEERAGLCTGESGAEGDHRDGYPRAPLHHYLPEPGESADHVSTGGRCSGTLIGPNAVATAGHCVHTGGSRRSLAPARQLQIYPGQTARPVPTASVRHGRCIPSLGWTTSRQRGVR